MANGIDGIGINEVAWEEEIATAQLANDMIESTPFTQDIHQSTFHQLLDLTAELTLLTLRVKQAIDDDLVRMGKAGVSILTADSRAYRDFFGIGDE